MWEQLAKCIYLTTLLAYPISTPEFSNLGPEPGMPIDYEVEYNNRARVPEHVEIFARWQREAADYRAKANAEEGCALGMSYGKTSRQIIDLFFPESSGTTPRSSGRICRLSLPSSERLTPCPRWRCR